MKGNILRVVESTIEGSMKVNEWYACDMENICKRILNVLPKSVKPVSAAKYFLDVLLNAVLIFFEVLRLIFFERISSKEHVRKFLKFFKYFMKIYKISCISSSPPHGFTFLI